MLSRVAGLGLVALVSACSSPGAPVLASFEGERDRIRATLSKDIGCAEDTVKQAGGGALQIRSYRCSVWAEPNSGGVAVELLGVNLQEESGGEEPRTIYTIYLSNAPEAEPFKGDFETLAAHYGLDGENLATCRSTLTSQYEGKGFRMDCSYQEGGDAPGFLVWITPRPA